MATLTGSGDDALNSTLSAVATHFKTMAGSPKPESAPKTLVFERCDANDEVVMSATVTDMTSRGWGNVGYSSCARQCDYRFRIRQCHAHVYRHYEKGKICRPCCVTRPASHFMDNIVFPERTFTLYPPV